MKVLARFISVLERRLSSRYAPWLVVAAAVALAAPSLSTGYVTDDFVMSATETHDAIALGDGGVDLFAFATGNPSDATRLRDIGVYPWWADGETKLHFFRPLASLTHDVDHALWPDEPALDHVQNLLWYALAVVAFWLVLRRGHGPRWLACFALALYAIDQTHGTAVAWIASRNGLMAAAFGFFALWAHDRWRRDGWRPGGAVGSVLFALAMASAEAGVATLGYLVAYAMLADRCSWRDRVLQLAPYAAVVCGFAAIYSVGSFGAHHATQYIDPIREPLRMAAAVAVRTPIFLQAIVGGPPSDAWIVYPMIHPALAPAIWVLGVLLVAVFGWLAWPILRSDRESRFWLVGSVLAIVPACAGFTSDRLLLFSGAGIVVIVSRVLAATVSGRGAVGARGGRLARIAVIALALHAIVINPCAFVWRVRATATGQAPFTRADVSLPADSAIGTRTLVIVNPPIEPMIYYAQYARAARGAVRPARTRVLATGGHELVIERVDETTLRVSSAAGLLSRTTDMMMRSSGRDLPAGADVELAGMRVTIERVTSDGLPGAVRFHFATDLDDSQLVWMRWSGTGFIPFLVPAIGATTTLPAIDLMDVFVR